MIYEIDSTCLGGGYTYCRTTPKHPKANTKGLYPLHRVMMENKMGRPLDNKEDVHHVDGNKYNDSIDNLSLISHAEHSSLHGRVERIERICPVCGGKFSLRPSVLRDRIKASRSGNISCSRECGRVVAGEVLAR